MRFRIEVNTLDGKLSYERDDPSEAMAVAEGGTESLGVTITDTVSGESYGPRDFKKQFGK